MSAERHLIALGHSNYNLTMSLYGHCLADTKKQEMNAIIIAI